MGVTLVTGASGFVGKALCRRMRELEWPTATLGRHTGADLVVDLSKPFRLDASSLATVTALVHCASTIPRAGRSEDDYDEVNVQGTRRLCEQLDQAPDLEHVVLLSSVSVHGRTGGGSRDDEVTPDGAYGLSKARQETVVREWAAQREVSLTVLRPSSIYGPGARADTVLPLFVERARRGQPLVVTAPRGAVQNFIHVDDVVECILASLRRRADGTFDVLADEMVSYLDLARHIAGVRGVEVHDCSGEGDARAGPHDNSAVRTELGVGFRPLADGLEELLR